MTCLVDRLQQSRLTALPDCLYQPTQADRFVRLNYAHINSNLLEQIGIDQRVFARPENLAFLLDHESSAQLQPISTVYAGHQFGIYTSKLGDGRVHILGDIEACDGAHWEIQLKGAGATPYARGNTGRMSLAEAITEYLGCEAMAGLGIPSTRGLALITSLDGVAGGLGDDCGDESILVRTAHSHLRFGHFEYLHNQGEPAALKELADYVIEHHYPELLIQADDVRYLQFLYAVTRRTARLLAQWQAMGFVHSVMNTDNMSILGLTIDYGVYGFMEAYDPGFSPNDNDDQNRYAFDQQIDVARWNCLALAEALVELLPGRRVPAALLRLYRTVFSEAFQSLMLKKLGLSDSHPDDGKLISDLLALLHQYQIDYTQFFRRFSRETGDGEQISADHAGASGSPHWPAAYRAWLESYRNRALLETMGSDQRHSIMRAHNPKYILRRHLLDNVIQRAAREHDFTPLHELLLVLQAPYEEHGGHEHLAAVR